jgi:hypothetical protein
MDAQWLTNGTPVAGATNHAFAILPELLGNGAHTVTVRIKDPTPFVRSDPGNLLTQDSTWNVVVSVPRLELVAPREAGEGRFAFTIVGEAPHGFVIQASTNLLDWMAISTNDLVAGRFDYTNHAAIIPGRMFRAAARP